MMGARVTMPAPQPLEVEYTCPEFSCQNSPSTRSKRSFSSYP